MKSYRVNITKSRAGHYRLTLICKADRYLKVTGLGWSTPEQARIMDEEKLAAELDMYRNRNANATGN